MTTQLCPFPIRAITPAEMIARREERAAERYQQLCEELEAADRAEYEAEFGEVFRARHPFKPNQQSIHARVTAMMAQDADEAAADRAEYEHAMTA